jgi:DNA-binding transcriptional MocR family regulator
MIATQWIEDGTADAILKSSRTEIRARVEIARAVLGARVKDIDPYCSHIWLPMSEVEAERTAGRAAAAGVDITSPSGPVLDSALIYGLRLCIGAPRNRTMLETGLKAVTAALAGGGDAAKDLV